MKNEHEESTTPMVAKVQMVGIPVALTAGIVTSFHTQMHLALYAGFVYAVAWLIPVAVVVWEAVSTYTWFATPTVEREARASARQTALMSIVVSLGLNWAYHWLHPGEAPLVVTLVVASVPNVVVMSLMHVAGKREADKQVPVAEVVVPVEAVVPVPEVAVPVEAVPVAEVAVPVLLPVPDVAACRKKVVSVPVAEVPVAETRVVSSSDNARRVQAYVDKQLEEGRRAEDIRSTELRTLGLGLTDRHLRNLLNQARLGLMHRLDAANRLPEATSVGDKAVPELVPV